MDKNQCDLIQENLRLKKENEELKCKYSQELMKNTELERDNE